MIRTIEELSMNAWPALQTMLYDGWVLRFADGYTNRANSINPLYPSTYDMRYKVEACEHIYRTRGLSVVFKTTADSQPTGLDALLADRGYRADRRTSVQILDLADYDQGPGGSADLLDVASEEWLAAYCWLGDIAGPHRATLQRMLSLIVPARCLASLRVDGRIVTCGMGVAQDGWVGLYDIVTDATCRRRGYGQRLVEQILAWGKRQGAQRAYLQVMTDNAPALALYDKLGFREAYLYWYRRYP